MPSTLTAADNKAYVVLQRQALIGHLQMFKPVKTFEESATRTWFASSLSANRTMIAAIYPTTVKRFTC